MRAMLVFLLLLMSAGNALGVIRSSTKGDGDRWYWRQIDGKRCWYKGAGRLPKSELHWPGDAPFSRQPAPLRRQPQPPVPEGTYGHETEGITAPAPAPVLSADRLRAAGQDMTVVPRLASPSEPAPSVLPVKQVTSVAIRKAEPPRPSDDLHFGLYFALFGTATLLSLAVVGVVAVRKLRGIGMAVS